MFPILLSDSIPRIHYCFELCFSSFYVQQSYVYCLLCLSDWLTVSIHWARLGAGLTKGTACNKDLRSQKLHSELGEGRMWRWMLFRDVFIIARDITDSAVWVKPNQQLSSRAQPQVSSELTIHRSDSVLEKCVYKWLLGLITVHKYWSHYLFTEPR